MCKPLITHQVICKDRSFCVLTVNTNTDSHEHGLRPFSNLTSELQKVRFFEGFESEVIVVQVSFVIDSCFVLVFVLHDEVKELLGDEGGFSSVLVDVVSEVGDYFCEAVLGLLVEVGDGDSSSED